MFALRQVSLGRWFKSGSVEIFFMNTRMAIRMVGKTLVRSGIRTHAHIRGPEYSTFMEENETLESGALDRSAILTCKLHVTVLAIRNKFFFESKALEDPGIDPGTSRMLSERSTI